MKPELQLLFFENLLTSLQPASDTFSGPLEFKTVFNFVW